MLYTWVPIYLEAWSDDVDCTHWYFFYWAHLFGTTHLVEVIFCVFFFHVAVSETIKNHCGMAYETWQPPFDMIRSFEIEPNKSNFFFIWLNTFLTINDFQIIFIQKFFDYYSYFRLFIDWNTICSGCVYTIALYCVYRSV